MKEMLKEIIKSILTFEVKIASGKRENPTLTVLQVNKLKEFNNKHKNN